MWDKGDPKKAFDKAIKCSKKKQCHYQIYFVLRDIKKIFLNLVKNNLDIVFANEQEITSLLDAKSFEEIISFSKQVKKT